MVPVGSESCFFVDGVGIGDSLELAFVALDGFGGGGRRERGIRVNVTASNGQVKKGHLIDLLCSTYPGYFVKKY